MNKVSQFFIDENIPFEDLTSGFRIRCFNKEGHKRGDLNPSLSVHPEKGFFNCFSCKISGSFPQLVGALAGKDKIKHYCGNSVSDSIKYDIETLNNPSNKIVIPGLGVFIKSVENEKVNNFSAVASSRKFSGFVEKDTSFYVQNSFEKRMKMIKLIEGDKDFFIVPDKYYKVDYLEYLYRRGLPHNFCKKYDVFLSNENDKYFYLPIYNVFNQIRTLYGFSFEKEQDPRSYTIKSISNPIMGIESVNKDQDIYIVEGWLDYFKLKVLGYNVIATLSNSFTSFHYSFINSFKGNKYFLFDQDKGGTQQVKQVCKFISTSDTSWYGLFIDYKLYKDVGDVDLFMIDSVLNSAKKIAICKIKEYILLLGAQKLHEERDNLQSNGYTLRSNPIFTEFSAKFSGV